MSIFSDNSDLYPTPEALIREMVSKLDWSRVNYILEPSTGSGNIVQYLREYRSRYLDISCIEIDDKLRNMLIGAGEKVVGTDFLSYAGLVQFDTIIMNPPFSNGSAHLLKAIELLFSGQIVCLLNAETIRHPKTLQQYDLKRKLEELEAEVEFKQNTFTQAERKTTVEVALVYINIERSFEDVFEGATDRVREYNPKPVDDQIKDLAKNSTIESIVEDYNHRVKIGIEFIQEYYSKEKYIGSYMALKTDLNNDGARFRSGTQTESIKQQINEFLKNIRHDFWNQTLSLPAFEKRLTQRKSKEFRESLKQHSDLEFTVKNVRAFFENLMFSYEDTLLDAIEDLFDKMTVKYAFNESLHNKNVHYYNGWKTNDAFQVNKKVILPYIGVEHWVTGYQLRYAGFEGLDDIDKVMNYFDGKSDYLKISQVADSVKNSPEIFSMLESEYFKIRFYKKGTTHLTFKSEDIRRRFNIEVGKRKGWLPQDYGYTPFEQLSCDVQDIVRSFEVSVEDYDKNLNQIGVVTKDLKMIA